MTYGELLVELAKELSSSDSPYLDARLLLAASLGVEPPRILSMLPENLAVEPPKLASLVERRKAGEAVAYILGGKEFWGKNFYVDARVLVPRPETELLVELALKIGDEFEARAARAEGRGTGEVSPIRLHDAFTGSGAVAVAVAGERPKWLVSASDISPGALEVAQKNSIALLGRALPLYESDALAALRGPFDIIAANPPYVPSEETDRLLSSGWKEPRLALDGGRDGLSVFPRLIRQAGDLLRPGGALLVEADPSQMETLRGMFEEAGFESIETRRDLAGLERLCGAAKPAASSRRGEKTHFGG